MTETTLQTARRTLQMEAEAILAMAARLDHRFEAAVERMLNCKGRVVVTGMGKSGLIAKKIAATLSSTGTPAFFLHPAEGSHGDIGMVTRRDLVMALSNSGETDELLALLPIIKRLEIPLISLTGRPESTLARMSEVSLDTSVAQEACPLGLAPTSSTTAALAMGDALAVALLERRDFAPEQFALLHPGGSLGRRLLTRAADLMHRGDEMPLVRQDDTIREAILEMTAKRFGATGVLDEAGRLVGIITDGDLRRSLERDTLATDLLSGTIMTPSPRSIQADALAMEGLARMQEHKISVLFVKDRADQLVGVLHLHDLLAAGLV